MAINIPPHFTIPDHELDVRFSASGGPGGQHANKAATRVELMWDIEASVILTEKQRGELKRSLGNQVRVVVDDERSQLRNRAIAEDRLAQRVKHALRTRKKRRPTKPSRSAKRRRMDAKSRRSQTKALRRRPTED